MNYNQSMHKQAETNGGNLLIAAYSGQELPT